MNIIDKKYFNIKGLIGFVGFTSLLFSVPALAADDNAETVQLLDAFGEAFEVIKRDYVNEVSDKELIEAAISGMLSSLDPHSGYFNEEALKDFKSSTSGKFGGLGMQVTLEQGVIKVIAPIDGTPASRGGVLAGDLITHLDGESVQGLSLYEAVERMRGKPGTKIIISVFREGNDPFDLTLKREVIQTRSVKAMTFDNIGYLRITSFTENTTRNLVQEVKKIRSQAKKSQTPLLGFVLDLRNNPGGLLKQAVLVSDAFLEQGEIVSTRGRGDDNSSRSQARAGDITDNLPLVVLINNGSASASEIVAGALQDHKRALIVGTTSFGKGSVQNIFGLQKYPKAAIKLTIQRYYTPSGKSIQGTGIVPDIEIPTAKIEILKQPQRFEKDLRGALNAEGEEAEPKNNVNNDNRYKDDYQLQRSLDILKAIAFKQTD